MRQVQHQWHFLAESFRKPEEEGYITPLEDSPIKNHPQILLKSQKNNLPHRRRMAVGCF